MTQGDIAAHILMKKKYASYPKLPKFILTREDVNYKTPNKGLMRSCLSGFYSRVDNWYFQHPGA